MLHPNLCLAYPNKTLSGKRGSTYAAFRFTESIPKPVKGPGRAREASWPAIGHKQCDLAYQNF